MAPSEIIQSLGIVGREEFYDHYSTVQSILKWLRYEGLISLPRDLDAIQGSMVWRQYTEEYEAHKIKQEIRQENRTRAEEEAQINRLKRQRKASNDLANAVKRGDKKAVKALIEKGADPDLVTTHNNISAREIARQRGEEDIYFPDTSNLEHKHEHR